eukprot:COSAG04_NODE_759_length_10538_cov_6.234218_7_plen_212_part_00
MPVLGPYPRCVFRVSVYVQFGGQRHAGRLHCIHNQFLRDRQVKPAGARRVSAREQIGGVAFENFRGRVQFLAVADDFCCHISLAGHVHAEVCMLPTLSAPWRRQTAARAKQTRLIGTQTPLINAGSAWVALLLSGLCLSIVARTPTFWPNHVIPSAGSANASGASQFPTPMLNAERFQTALALLRRPALPRTVSPTARSAQGGRSRTAPSC